MTSISSLKEKIRPVLVLVFWLAVWQIAALLIDQDLILVSPLQTFKVLISQPGQASFWGAIAWSSLRIVGGFLLAIVVALLLAWLSASYSLIRSLLSPLFNVLKSVPVVSFTILVLIWAGSRNLSLVICFLMVLPVMYTNILEGILHTDKKQLEMAQVFRFGPRKTLRAVYLPALMPFFKAGAKLSLGLCWKSGLAAEVIGLPTGSIGEQLYQSKIFLDTGLLFSWTIVIIAIAYLFEKLFMHGLSLLERKLQA